MAMGTLSESEDDFNPEINTTPLVDVMLVLLIIFMITMPVVNHAVKIDLPRATSQPDEIKPQSIDLAFDSQGAVSWNDQAIDQAELGARITAAAQQKPLPELHLRAARNTPYEKIALVMSLAQSGGLNKMGFVTEPAK